LATVIDLYSRKVVGWSTISIMRASLVCDASDTAIWQRQSNEVLIVHSDRGVQNTSMVYRRLIKTCSFVGSMSKKGCR
jgi:putative transposase